MREFEQMDIDGIALCNALTERGISLTEASKMLYRSVGYMSVVKSSGKIRKGDYTLLKMTLKYNDVPFTEEEMDKIEKKVKTPEQEQRTPVQCMVENVAEVLQPQRNRLQGLWWQGNNRVR